MSDENKRGWISEIYEGFFLRDILSFVVPGSLGIVGTYVVLTNDVSRFLGGLITFIDNLKYFRDISMGAAIIIYIVFFGITYVTGFFIQELGIILKIIRHYFKSSLEEFENRVTYKDVSYQIYDKKCCKKDKYFRVVFYNLVQEFRRSATSYEKKIDERNLVLRQMIGNTAVSLLIPIVIYIVKSLSAGNLAKDIVGIGFVILLPVILLREHHVLLERESDWRLIVLSRAGKIK